MRGPRFLCTVSCGVCVCVCTGECVCVCVKLCVNVCASAVWRCESAESVVERRGVERSGEGWSGEERSGHEWNGVEGVERTRGEEWRGVERGGNGKTSGLGSTTCSAPPQPS